MALETPKGKSKLGASLKVGTFSALPWSGGARVTVLAVAGEEEGKP